MVGLHNLSFYQTGINTWRACNFPKPQPAPNPVTSLATLPSTLLQHGSQQFAMRRIARQGLVFGINTSKCAAFRVLGTAVEADSCASITSS
ncbi:MAG TPA: hypothetical protein VMV88_03335 [Gallionella sp.]|nr:hypothetical protein [Gallionella sp.]